MTAHFNQDFVSFLDSASSEESKSDLSEGSVVIDLVVNVLQVDDMAHVGFHEQVLRFFDFVVESVMVNLVECSLDSQFRSSKLVHFAYEVFDGFNRVFEEVDVL